MSMIQYLPFQPAYLDGMTEIIYQVWDMERLCGSAELGRVMAAKYLCGCFEESTFIMAAVKDDSPVGLILARAEGAEPGEFEPKDNIPFAKEGFSKKTDAAGYSVIADTKGRLLWGGSAADETPLIIVTSEQVSKEYLDSQNISWIACGKTKIDLARAVEILAVEFGVKRMAVVGGGNINAGFLDAGLLDEISMMIAPGIDGRGGIGASFDGRSMNEEPVHLKLEEATPYDNGVAWMRYTVL